MKKPPRTPDDHQQDQELWARSTHDVKPLPKLQKTSPAVKRGPITQPPSGQKPDLRKKPQVSQPQISPPQISQTKPPPLPQQPAGNGLDHRTSEKLRRGQMPIDARLDLHGHNKEYARQALIQFIQRAYQQDFRTVLVITGKGRQGQSTGVLKKHVPLWLNEPPLQSLILTSMPSKPRDGGEGALYVYIRRRGKTGRAPATS